MTTPREELVQELAYVVGKERAEQLTDAFAHQLAEQIRTDAQVRHDRDFSDNRIFRLTGARTGADLIDPQTTP